MADQQQLVSVPGRRRADQRELPAEFVPGYGQAQYLEEETIDLRDYLAVILRRKWTILTVFLIVVVTVGIYTFKTRPVYKASATVEINAAQPQLTPFSQASEARLVEQARYLSTQADILKSRTLATRVIEVLDLEHNKEFNNPNQHVSILSQVRGFVSSLIRQIGGAGDTTISPEDKARLERNRLVKQFLTQLNVKLDRKGSSASYLLDVSFQAHDPKLCAEVVNTLISEYIRFDLEKRIQATKLGHRYIKKQIEKVQGKLEQAEERLNSFLKRHDIVFLTQLNQKGQGGQDIATAQLVSLTEELNKARTRRISLESLYQLSKTSPDDLPQVVNDPLIQKLKEELSKLQAEYADLSSVFTPEYPKMKRIRSKVASLKEVIAREKHLIITTIRTRYETALKNEKMLQAALQSQKKKVSRLKRMAIDYNILKREVDTNQHIYELLLNKAKEMDVEVGIKSSGIHPIDEAIIPAKPFKPKKTLNLLLAMMVGLFSGVFGAFVLEYFDNTFKGPEEVEKQLGIPILGVLPHVQLKKSEVKEEGRLIELEVLANPRSALAEAFRMIRTSLMLSAAGSPPQSLVVTSPQVGAGKTFVALNLAIVYAQMDARVLLLEGDLRKPRQHKLIQVSSNPGLSNYLTGKMDLKTITKPVGHSLGDGLDIDFIPSGAIPPNPVELLNSQILADTLGQFRKAYDIIIIDTPPLVGFADSLVLGRLADGTLLVIRNEQTPRPTAKHSCELLAQVGVNLLGAVVNDIKVGKGSYYYGKYYSYYHYYYGKYYSKEGKPELTGRVG